MRVKMNNMEKAHKDSMEQQQVRYTHNRGCTEISAAANFRPKMAQSGSGDRKKWRK